MAELEDIIDFESPEENDVSDEYEEEEEGLTETASDVSFTRPSDYNIESISAVTNDQQQSLQLVQASKRITALKKRYTRRISLFEITGIIAESYNLLQRGRLPLVSGLSNETLKEKMLHIVIREIKENTCPIIIEKNGELLSVKDFDQKGLWYHLDYIISIWKTQKRY